MRIYNTMTRGKEEFTPLTPGEARIYVCGVTPYDYSHIGHARSAVVFDVIRRWLEYRGLRVTTVRNYTDIDDKIIARSNQEGVSAIEVARRYIEAEGTDMQALGVLPPTVAPKATDHVAGMIALIERLVTKGVAYVVDGDVYFEIRRFPPYGKLSGKNLDELLAGARVEVDERKRDPRDFALWKAVKPGEPSWPSPWGPGRPGWHIECSVMSMRYLGETFDIHGGGTDLIFPHHECEIAQSEADTGKTFARYWLHNGMLNLGAEKMSKSLGNTLTIRSLLERHHTDGLRAYLLAAHYRSQIEFLEARIDETQRALSRVRRLFVEAFESSQMEDPANPTQEMVSRFVSRVAEPGFRSHVELEADNFSNAMDDDFNTAQAIGALFRLHTQLAQRIESYRTGREWPSDVVEAAKVLLSLGRVLGLFQKQYRRDKPSAEMTAKINEADRLLSEREEARQRRDWKLADELRARIEALGARLKDGASGTRIVWKDE